ncbi:hypothetical protein ASE26_21505 [Duganella sp. Root198D2]|nr:hypothetical protein ASD07_14515 [Duganella sp. Root336D2]KRC00900.1 hypothetical protein ASE26_21505 [Duganella sp. Root198D2]
MAQASATKAHGDETKWSISFDGDGARAQGEDDCARRLPAIEEIRCAVMEDALGTGSGWKQRREGMVTLPTPVAIDKGAQLRGRAKMPALLVHAGDVTRFRPTA